MSGARERAERALSMPWPPSLKILARDLLVALDRADELERALWLLEGAMRFDEDVEMYDSEVRPLLASAAATTEQEPTDA